jgi:hypothetical protein
VKATIGHSRNFSNIRALPQLQILTTAHLRTPPVIRPDASPCMLMQVVIHAWQYAYLLQEANHSGRPPGCVQVHCRLHHWCASRSSLAHIRQVTNGCAQSVSKRLIPLLNDRSCLVCLPAAALFSSTSTSFNDTSLARYRFAMWSPSIWYELFALRHLSVPPCSVT